MPFLGPSLRRRRVYERPGARTAIALAGSILLNGLVIWLLLAAGAFQPAEPRAQARPVALAPLSADRWEANRAIVGGPPPARPPPAPQLPVIPKPPAPEEPARERGQVVTVAPSKDGRRPADARFLSDRDNTVEKETRSRHAGRQFHENVLPEPSDGAKRPPQELIGEGGDGARSAPGKPGQTAQGGTGADRPAMPRQQAQEQLALAPRPETPGTDGEIPVAPRGDRQELAGEAERLELPGAPGEAEGGARRAGKIDPRLLPDPSSMARIAGGPSLDRLDGVEVGDATALNTRSFKYASFYQRMYRAIASEWNPIRPYDLRDPERRLYPVKERTTGLVIVMDAGGALDRVRVVDPSGLDFLDEEAVRAVRAAAPFPNPPAGMVERDGQVRVAFTFTLSFEQSGRVHVVLPPNPSQRPYPDR